MGSSVNDDTVLKGKGEIFFEGSTKALVIKLVMLGGGGVRSNIVQICFASVMDDPICIEKTALSHFMII